MAHATIRDVARAANVSIATVSRALNGHSTVRDAVRQHVQSVADALGYVPHTGARSLSLARTNAIGVMLPDLHGEFYSEALRGIDGEASARGLQLLLSNMHGDQRGAETLRFMRGRVDALIIMAPDIDPEKLLAHLPASLPTVLISCPDLAADHPQFRIDNAAAADAMVEHLIASGRRRIVHLAGPRGNRDAEERVAGYRDAMTRNGLDPRIIAGNFDEESGTAAAAELIGEAERADALFAANDMMAIGALVAFQRAGLAVPGDIAVAGFDDIPLARFVTPSLTTLRVGIAEIGAEAVSRIAAILAGGEDTEIRRVVPEVIPRASTAAV
ncbi:LacI family DNA-binding transcriptional regulator [Sphingomonas sp. AR_OL41]|uniref:LacI family DNA-binding transcriptional regulator n=1 Tax=Sphingomonas sp. AR_OL41 TaxID=3042729 RepID=UPI002480C14F|nr:LacI family DNA-binding transcriptional regulator [Sphingomonas sp. AR_OL41]MDH7972875.1 LacI family DNA-binding transcriptional regulator [Sphingomonas sp. AR_OL41]